MIEEFSIYPSVNENSLSSFNNGETEIRACPVIEGTVCEGMIQGTFIEKFEECRTCEFYKKTKQEEENSFIPAISDIKKPG